MTSVLVVDDDQDLAEMLGIVLNGAGIEVDLVSRGDEAIEAFRNNQPDLVLLDIQRQEGRELRVARDVARGLLQVDQQHVGAGRQGQRAQGQGGQGRGDGLDRGVHELAGQAAVFVQCGVGLGDAACPWCVANATRLQHRPGGGNCP